MDEGHNGNYKDAFPHGDSNAANSDDRAKKKEMLALCSIVFTIKAFPGRLKRITMQNRKNQVFKINMVGVGNMLRFYSAATAAGISCFIIVRLHYTNADAKLFGRNALAHRKWPRQ